MEYMIIECSTDEDDPVPLPFLVLGRIKCDKCGHNEDDMLSPHPTRAEAEAAVRRYEAADRRRAIKAV